MNRRYVNYRTGQSPYGKRREIQRRRYRWLYYWAALGRKEARKKLTTIYYRSCSGFNWDRTRAGKRIRIWTRTYKTSYRSAKEHRDRIEVAAIRLEQARLDVEDWEWCEKTFHLCYVTENEQAETRRFYERMGEWQKQYHDQLQELGRRLLLLGIPVDLESAEFTPTYRGIFEDIPYNPKTGT